MTGGLATSGRPAWLRVKPAIRSFILGEVERQYHPIGTEEYRERVEWMTDAWMWAQERASKYGRPRTLDVLHLAAFIEPEVNRNGYRSVPVYVGDHQGMEPDRIHESMERLWNIVADVQPRQGRADYLTEAATADDFYLEFERIHPFRDGNGRTGKILHNWLLGTLDAPVLVADYFGGGNP